MELFVTNRAISSEPEPRYHNFAVEPLSNSNYKKIADKTYKSASSTSVFGIRQHLKIKRFNSILPIDVVLKVSIFAVVLAILF
ncbi:hypothetical protein [Winogradskyella sp. A3E31]|uniref:hypothetical protein n=1 Tax=Winogradskyella sp. A3E31 TaxID=3349637 RepID=UPI00398B60A7